MTTAHSLNDLLRLAGEHAHQMLVGGEVKELVATYQLWNRKECRIVACPWHDEADKELAFAAVKILAEQMGATQLVFLSEAWLATEELARMDPPSQRPDRQEVVFAVATDGKAKKARRWAIVRNKPGGKITDLVEQSEAGTFSGRAIDGILRGER